MTDPDWDLVDSYAAPDGTPDRLLPEKEARLWLLSQQQRSQGAQVFFDPETERWRPVGAFAPTVHSIICGRCEKPFPARRTTARYCSPRCARAAQRGVVSR